MLFAALCVFCAWPSYALVFDLPLRDDRPISAPYLRGEPVEWEDFGIRRVEIPLAEPAGEELLAVTVIFEEKDTRRLRAVWNSPDVPGLEIAPQLGEGITGWNQRTFFLPSEVWASAGNLVIESEGASRMVHRVVLQLLQPSAAFVPPNRVGDVFAATAGGFNTLRELDAPVEGAPPDAWFGNMIEAWLQERAEPAGEGVEFLVEIRPAARRAVVRFSWNGRGVAPSLVVNGKPVERVNIEVPSLQDPAYIEDGGALFYAGWRQGWAMLPENVLLPGDNSFVFTGTSPADYIKSARIEMWFDEPVAPVVPNESILEEIDAGRLPSLPGADLPEAWNPEPAPAAASQKQSQPLAPASAGSSTPSLNLFRTSVR